MDMPLYKWRNRYERIISLLLPEMRIFCFLSASQKRCLPRMLPRHDAVGYPNQDFTDLDHEERDRLISVKMIESAPSLVKRITAPEKLHRQRKLVGALVERNMELESEINTLNATIDWMHETIWKQLRVKQALTEELRDLKTSSEPERLNS